MRLEIRGRAEEYCRRRDIALDANLSLGFGVHGSVFACLRATATFNTALKIHERERSYLYERDVYIRLRDLGIEQIEGHHVPALIDYDDELLAIEMSIVVRPFLLDFGGAYLDRPPDYDSEVLEQWEIDKQEQFEENWPKASIILAKLRSLGIYIADVNPGNIGFARNDEKK